MDFLWYRLPLTYDYTWSETYSPLLLYVSPISLFYIASLCTIFDNSLFNLSGDFAIAELLQTLGKICSVILKGEVDFYENKIRNGIREQAVNLQRISWKKNC